MTTETIGAHAEKLIRSLRAQGTKPAWLLIANGPYFRLHRLVGLKAKTNRGQQSVGDAVDYACRFCFGPGEIPVDDNVRFYAKITDMPEFYRKELSDVTVLVTNCHPAYAPERRNTSP